ncbi:hypothetical protein DPEC_G00295180 [Dallia pectoralis]|uniref:Uncharacterized protein n=1 Tax=Dallia pectoralis TaxID=75939 RepID=A0ACC2FIR6_DALPE|nr:hypothetical protein DPEC_G00295180 [Dallia pectoralis]
MRGIGVVCFKGFEEEVLWSQLEGSHEAVTPLYFCALSCIGVGATLCSSSLSNSSFHQHVVIQSHQFQCYRAAPGLKPPLASVPVLVT